MKNTHRISKKHSEELWESRKLGADEKFVRRAPLAKERRIDEKLGLQMISIRLMKSLIDELKELAAEDGIGYQPYIRRLLTRHVRNEKLNKLKKHG